MIKFFEKSKSQSLHRRTFSHPFNGKGHPFFGGFFSINTPDGVTLKNNKDEIIKLFYNNDCAMSFLFDISENKPIFNKTAGGIHMNIVKDLNKSDDETHKHLELNKIRTILESRQNPNFRSGRLWDITFNDKPTLVISWWHELTTEQFRTYNKSLIENYFVENRNKTADKSINDYTFYFVDNNHNVFELGFENIDTVELSERTQISKEATRRSHAIHLASQDEKSKFFANFKKTRDIKNQKLYNGTKSKTEAEYHALKYIE